MCDKSDKVLKLLKIALRAGSPGEQHAGIANASKIALTSGLDFFALLAQAQAELGMGAQSAQAEEPKRESRDVRQEPTWNDVNRHVYKADTKYDPDSRQSRAMLARALRDVLQAAGFTYSYDKGRQGETKEEVWEKVVGRGQDGDVKVWVFTSIINGHTDAQGKRVLGEVRGRGTDQIRVCAKGVSSKTRNGRKGHTVKRVGRFGSHTEGRDHRHRNNPGILGRLYREILNVQDEALKIAQATKREERTESAESAEEFVRRMYRDCREDLDRMAHPARQRAAAGDTMCDYVAWIMRDERNARDRRGNCRWAFAQERIESYMG